MSEIDAVKVLAASPRAMFLVLLGIMIFVLTISMVALFHKRTHRKNCISEEGNKTGIYSKLESCLNKFPD